MPWELANYDDYQKAALFAMIDERIKAEKEAAARTKKKRR
jgi:non-homologous end joining protein Ku